MSVINNVSNIDQLEEFLSGENLIRKTITKNHQQTPLQHLTTLHIYPHHPQQLPPHPYHPQQLPPYPLPPIPNSTIVI